MFPQWDEQSVNRGMTAEKIKEMIYSGRMIWKVIRNGKRDVFSILPYTTYKFSVPYEPGCIAAEIIMMMTGIPNPAIQTYGKSWR